MAASPLEKVGCIGGVSGLALFCLTGEGVARHLIPPARTLQTLTDEQLTDDTEAVEARLNVFRTLLRTSADRDAGYRYLISLLNALNLERSRRAGNENEVTLASIVADLEACAAGLKFYDDSRELTFTVADPKDARAFAGDPLPCTVADFAETADEVRFIADVSKRILGGIILFEGVLIDTVSGFAYSTAPDQHESLRLSSTAQEQINEYLSDLWSNL